MTWNFFDCVYITLIMPLEIKEILLPRLPWKTFDLVDYFYVPWYTCYIDIMNIEYISYSIYLILNIFQIYFKLSSQKVEVCIFLWYSLIHEDFHDIHVILTYWILNIFHIQYIWYWIYFRYISRCQVKKWRYVYFFDALWFMKILSF